MIGTPYGIAKFYNNKIVWDESTTNELGGHDINMLTPCTNQNKGGGKPNLLPLCVSFKPGQDEFIWKKIGWEKRRRA
jgi:hypothetical protein